MQPRVERGTGSGHRYARLLQKRRELSADRIRTLHDGIEHVESARFVGSIRRTGHASPGMVDDTWGPSSNRGHVADIGVDMNPQVLERGEGPFGWIREAHIPQRWGEVAELRASNRAPPDRLKDSPAQSTGIGVQALSVRRKLATRVENELEAIIETHLVFEGAAKFQAVLDVLQHAMSLRLVAMQFQTETAEADVVQTTAHHFESGELLPLRRARSCRGSSQQRSCWRWSETCPYPVGPG